MPKIKNELLFDKISWMKDKFKMKYKKKISLIIYIVSILMIVGILVYFGINTNVDVVDKRNNSGFEVIKKYKFSNVRNSNLPAGIQNVYEFELDDNLKADNCIGFYLVYQCAEVFIDDELVYSLAPNDELLFGNNPGCNWALISLNKGDAGKRVKIVITPVYKGFADRRIEILVGSELSIYRDRLRKDLPQIIVGCMSILVGLVFIILYLIDFFGTKKDKSLFFLGLFSMMLGIWKLSDTRFSPFFISERPALISSVTMLMLMFGLIPLLMAGKKMINRKFSVVIDICCFTTALWGSVQILLQVFDILDLRETLFCTHILLIICAMICVISLCYDFIQLGWNKMSGIKKGFLFICSTGVLFDIIAFYIKGNSSGIIFTLLSFLTFIILSGVINVHNMIEKEKKMKEQEAELAQSRISVMISQIQPHFLYNSLNTIYHLCDKNPGLAKKAISDFSDYLRGNLESLKLNNTVDFSKELDHVMIYLSLEKMRFDDELEIIYDIETTAFFIPALTVQPIVENAVKHGINKSENGGTVTISTREKSDCYEVIVLDNGIGFNPGEKINDGKMHVGIENVKKRLWEMSKATMEINSTMGEGTKVTIKIPKIKDSDGGIV